MTDEKEIMLLVQAGQIDKLAILFENNKGKLFSYFLRMGNNSALSEDLVQETFMKVLAYRSSFNGSSTFSSWLYGIARNTSADHYRKTRHSRHYEDIDEIEVAGEQSLDQRMENAQQDEMFAKSLAELAPEQREIIILSRFGQLNYQDIAALLDCNLNTLKSKMRNAIGKLHDGYRKLSGETSL